MRVAFVGCGFVADYYRKTLGNHRSLTLVGVYDRDPVRARRFASMHKLYQYGSLEEILGDQRVEMVVNLTNPSSHYEISKAALNAGKHVYSEKPLAMDFAHAVELVELAKQRNLQISSAPCSVLSETAQTIWKAVRDEVVGPVRLVYAEMDDGMVHRFPYQKWQSESGIPWPYKDEFEVGCTLEHAGYYTTWLTAIFGPVKSVTAYSSVTIPDKKTDVKLDKLSADFSVGIMQFVSGLTARLTCGIVAPHDHQLTIVGEDGIMGTDDCWFYRSPVWVRKLMSIRRKTFINPLKKKLPLVGAGKSNFGTRGSQQMDFCRGVADLAAAITHNRRPRLPADFCLHNLELVLAIHNAGERAGCHEMKTTFEPVLPIV